MNHYGWAVPQLLPSQQPPRCPGFTAVTKETPAVRILSQPGHGYEELSPGKGTGCSQLAPGESWFSDNSLPRGMRKSSYLIV